jgi:antitoxin component of RelBE/YafQ-DinJ toxin-antitoxin module
MAKEATLQVRMDSELKEQVESLYKRRQSCRTK